MLRRLIGPEIEFEIMLRAASGATVLADPAQIEQVVMNLVINARDAMPDGGRLTVRVDEVELDRADGGRRWPKGAPGDTRGSASPTPAPAWTSRRARGSSSRSSRPRSKGKAPASASRSSTAS